MKHRKCGRCRQWLKDYGKDVSCDGCPDGAYKNNLNFMAVDTISFQINKNVSVKRIDMIKRRKLAGDGAGEVILTNHSGKETSRLASDY